MRAYHHKIEAARMVKVLGFPLTLNVVLHRHNIDHMQAVLGMAEELAADRIELANTQYYGWGLLNRAELLPSRDQLDRAEAVVRSERERLAGRMQIVYVVPDYYSRYPKPCMGGWGQRQLTVSPTGKVLPCPAAGRITGLGAENVRTRSLAWIWNDSPSFNRFRGESWMPQPCRGCPRRTIDFGGCRCQAFQLTGDAAATDPVCYLSPHHGLVERATAAANASDRLTNALVYRQPRADMATVSTATT
jgi:pyrroloquinoline quinone biosynthesis protein E